MALYSVPTTRDVHAAALTGLTHLSTFSGCGGTCTGFRLAGFRTLWANDCDPATWDSYRANHPEAILDTRSITEVTGAGILAATRLRVGEPDVFEGSPPCTMYSPLHTGARGKVGRAVDHAGASGVRVEELPFENARLVGETMPKVVVLENVSRWAAHPWRAYFHETRRRIRAHGYRVEARVLNASHYGVPQDRQRLILIGVRDDLGMAPPFPVPGRARYSLRDAVPGALHVSGYEFGRTKLRPASRPAATVTKTRGKERVRFANGEARPLTIPEVKALCSFPADYVLHGSASRQHARLGNSVPPLMAFAIAAALRDALLTLKQGG